MNNIGINVTDLGGTFIKCENLEVAPTIPEKVTNLGYTFQECTNLKNIGTIPESVDNMEWSFFKCHKLEGILEINCNPSDYTDCFFNCSTDIVGNLVLKGTSTSLDNLLNTKSSNSKIVIG